ncbi:MAG: glycosyltransferase [Candidatus Promineifilaceae bacterium]
MNNISLIFTVLNEGEGLRPLLDSLMFQTRMPDEIVVTDGGSTDDTLAILQEYQAFLPIRIIETPGANISEGRNQAIAATKGAIIAATDAGVVLSPAWVDAITRPIRLGDAQVVSGWFEPDPYTDFEVVMSATVLPNREDIDPHTFLPSSRSIAFLKTAWNAVGGYPEWLDYSEDLIFDMALRDQYGSFPFAHKAVAYFRPRTNMRAYAKQYYLYSRGDGKADLWRKRHAIRYTTYLIGLPILLFAIAKNKTIGWLLLIMGAVVYCLRPFARLYETTSGWRPFARAWAFSLVIVIRFVGDVAKMLGYPVGVLWRLRHREKSSLDDS